MPEDPLRLREELEQFNKDVKNKIHIKDTLDAHLKEMHSEELRYIQEISFYRKQHQENKLKEQESAGKVLPLQKILDDAQKKLTSVEGLVAESNKALANLKETQLKIIEDTKKINEDIKQRHGELKQRELAVDYREKSCELREVGCKNRDSELSDKEVELNHKIKAHDDAKNDLQEDIELYEATLDSHNNNIAAFVEHRRLFEYDKKDLIDKINKSAKLVKDHIQLKADLLMQIENMNKATELAENKQKSLDRSIADLNNQTTALKIRELKVNKLIKDHGLQEELKQLEDSLK